jgi:hypothetical protein
VAGWREAPAGGRAQTGNGATFGRVGARQKRNFQGERSEAPLAIVLELGGRAKPVKDVIVGVRSLEDSPVLVGRPKAVGYEYVPEGIHLRQRASDPAKEATGMCSGRRKLGQQLRVLSAS